MTEPSFYPYRAFISYSHRDQAWCDWLHKGLESFRMDSDLAGRVTPAGPVPRHLRPVFRDRAEFAAGSLQQQTVAALQSSQFLIVIASENSAKSDYVDAEIRQFKALHGEGRVLPLIVEGAPPQCFAPALREKIGPDGAALGAPADDVAGDIIKDGKPRALIKIVAGLTGLPFDDLWMRHVRETRKRAAYIGAGAGAFAVAALAAGVFSYEHFGTKQTVAKHSEELQTDVRRIEHLEALVTQLIAASPAQAREAPGLKEAVTGAVEYADRGAQAGDARLKQALDLLQQNKVAEADALFGQVAAAAEQAGRRSNKEAAEAYRHQGAIAALHEPWKAREAYAKAVALDPANAEGLERDGWFQLKATHLDAAEKSYRALLSLEGKGADESQIFWARSGLGDIAVARGDLKGALAFYGDARAAMERLSSSDAGNADWQRDLSVSYDRVGDVLVSQGNLAEALKSYRAGLAIAERLSSSDAGNADWQRDLSVSYNKIGDVLVKQGNLAEALKSYRAGLAIAERLSSSAAGNADWQRDLSVSYAKLGDVYVKSKESEKAREALIKGHAIIAELVAKYPDWVEWKQDLAWFDAQLAALPNKNRGR